MRTPFTASINLGHHPKRWRRAKIVVLPKPGKPDYAVLGPTARSHSLTHWANLSRRLWRDGYDISPKSTVYYQTPNLAGDRATEQALLVLSNAIDRAWYKNKVVTLVAFDLTGAGVNKVSLDACHRARRIPTVARKWIASFMNNRHASIGFDDFRTEVTLLLNAGLAQD